MSMDHDRSDKPITEQEGVMFAANPAWERGRKRKGLGGRKISAAPAATAAAVEPTSTITPEPRTFAAERDYEEPMALDRPVARPVERPMTPDAAGTEYSAMGATMASPRAAALETDSGMVAPIGREPRRTAARTHKSSAAPAAIAAGVAAVALVGAAGWYATQADDGIPELAPGQPADTQVATAPLPQAPLPAETSATAPTTVNPTAPPVRAQAPARAERRMAQAAPRTRPAAAAPSASESGLNASTTTTLPDGPQPYSTLNPGAAPAPVNPPAPPVNQAAPAPTTEAPAAIPATPPTLPSEPSTTEPPKTEAPPTTATPPTS